VEGRDETDDTPDFETREEWAAAAEARSIGGPPQPVGPVQPDEPVDEALRPLYEAGEGEQEGFEQAEYDLVRNASHDDGEGYPERDRFSPESESDRAGIEYAEADQEEPADR
jgi:hypothetical protein